MVDESSFPLSKRQVLKKNHENKGFAPKVTVVTSSIHLPSPSQKCLCLSSLTFCTHKMRIQTGLTLASIQLHVLEALHGKSFVAKT